MNEHKNQGLAITSLVSGIAGFFIFGIILGIVAIITGALSWESKMGKAGCIIGIIDVVALLIFFG